MKDIGELDLKNDLRKELLVWQDLEELQTNGEYQKVLKKIQDNIKRIQATLED